MCLLVMSRFLCTLNPSFFFQARAIDATKRFKAAPFEAIVAELLQGQLTLEGTLPTSQTNRARRRFRRAPPSFNSRPSPFSGTEISAVLRSTTPPSSPMPVAERRTWPENIPTVIDPPSSLHLPQVLHHLYTDAVLENRLPAREYSIDTSRSQAMLAPMAQEHLSAIATPPSTPPLDLDTGGLIGSLEDLSVLDSETGVQTGTEIGDSSAVDSVSREKFPVEWSTAPVDQRTASYVSSQPSFSTGTTQSYRSLASDRLLPSMPTTEQERPQSVIFHDKEEVISLTEQLEFALQTHDVPEESNPSRAYQM